MYTLNNWTLSNVDYVTPQPGEAPVAGRNYVTINVPDLTKEPFTNLCYRNTIADSDIGNTLEVVCNFSDAGSGTYFTLSIEDGTNKAAVDIYKGFLKPLNGSDLVPITNTGQSDHRYTLTLKNGHFSVLFDTIEVYSEDVTNSSDQKMLGVGFFEEQTGSMEINFRYIKQTPGIYKYIKLDEVDFELQIDSKNTFDSPNLHTYTKSSFDNIPQTLDDWSPASLISGNYTGSGYDFCGLLQAAAVHLPPKQPNEDIPFYYRVRFHGGNYESDWSDVYLTERVKPQELTVLYQNDNRKIGLELTDLSQRYVPVTTNIPYIGILLPETPTTNQLTFTIYNASEYTIKIYSRTYNSDIDTIVYFNPTDVDPHSIIRVTYDEDTDKWYPSIVQKRATFVLPQNIAPLVFTAVYKYHLPAYDFVYTKTYNSGNVADYVRALSYSIDEMYDTIVDGRNNLNSSLAMRDDFNDRWKSVFGLDNSLFKNSAEMRDTFQCLLANLNGELLKKRVAEMIMSVTGAMPVIVEYKDVNFNILGSKDFYIYDENHPIFDKKPFILYGGTAKAFSWEINVFDPYNLQYNQNLIKNILDMFKPVYSFVIVKFYDFEGRPLTKRYVYSYDEYGESAYNGGDTPTPEPEYPNESIMAEQDVPLLYSDNGVFVFTNPQ